jgi:hypothetical protein
LSSFGIKPRASYSKTLQSMRILIIIQGKQWKRIGLSILKLEHRNLRNRTNLLRHMIEQNCISTILVTNEFHNLIFLFDTSALTDTRQLILFLQACLMALCTERSNVRLIVATDCIISISAHSKNKDAEMGKIRGTEVH